MADLEYRIKTTSMGAISPWRPLNDQMLWDYRATAYGLTFFEIRVKPDFVPGYYRAIAQVADNPCVWFNNAWTLEKYAEDEGLLSGDFERVNVTPVAE